MPGRQAVFASRGAQNEAVAQDLIGRLSAPVKVPREHDFGIDYFCQLYTAEERRTVAADQIFALQVKGENDDLAFGGVRDGQWRNYEITWLRTQQVPLFLARVNADDPTLHIHSLGPVWRVLWQSAEPFEIHCPSAEPTDTLYRWPGEESVAVGYQYGDSRCWTVPLGPPFLSLTHGRLSDADWRSKARELLKYRLELDRVNLLLFHFRVAVHYCLDHWATNDFTASRVLTQAMYWSRERGANIRELATALEPVVINLGVHLQWQNDSDAYRLIDVLEWLDQRGALTPMGQGLLRGLVDTRQKGLPPKPA